MAITHLFARTRQTGEAVVALRLVEQRACKREIPGKGQDREPAAIEPSRFVRLCGRPRGREQEEQRGACEQR